jgi:hypothetical protein
MVYIASRLLGLGAANASYRFSNVEIARSKNPENIVLRFKTAANPGV